MFVFRLSIWSWSQRSRSHILKSVLRLLTRIFSFIKGVYNRLNNCHFIATAATLVNAIAASLVTAIAKLFTNATVALFTNVIEAFYNQHFRIADNSIYNGNYSITDNCKLQHHVITATAASFTTETATSLPIATAATLITATAETYMWLTTVSPNTIPCTWLSVHALGMKMTTGKREIWPYGLEYSLWLLLFYQILTVLMLELSLLTKC